MRQLFSVRQLKRLDQKWPPTDLTSRFDELAALAIETSRQLDWEGTMKCLVAHLIGSVGTETDRLHNDLRRISAAISMFVHLIPHREPDGSIQLVNERRKRTRYGSYPTSPVVAEVMAKYVSWALRGERQPVTIFDPTIEGAPLLLECARSFAHRPQTRLVGVDISPPAVEAAGSMFESARRSAPSYLQPELICGNAFEIMKGMESIDGLVNNPPWGERERNGKELFRGASDPCSFFVRRGLELLKPGGPFALVLPGQVATSRSNAALRRLFIETCSLHSITTLPARCFRRATVRTILLLGRKNRPDEKRSSILFVNYPLRQTLEKEPPPMRRVPQRVLGAQGTPWLACATLPEPSPVGVPSVPLDRLAIVRLGIVPYRRGRGSPRQTAETLSSRPFTYSSHAPGTVPVLRSRQISAFACAPSQEFVRLGPQLAHVGNHALARYRRRIFVRELCARDGHLTASVAPPGSVPRYGVFSIEIESEELSEKVLCAILNSSEVARHVRTSCDGMFKESFNRIRIGDLRALPISRSLLGPGKEAKALIAAVDRLEKAGNSGIARELAAQVDALVSTAYSAL